MTNLANLPIPIEVLYAGLGGTVLALIVATIQNNWSLRVFFLLTLRLAIGWHFLFEGLYKVNSYFVGPTDTNRVFTSEPYFRVAPGPIGALMRKQFDDPAATIEVQVKRKKDISPEVFAKLSIQEQADECPSEVVKQLDAVKQEPEKERKKAEELEKRETDEAKSDEAKARAKAKADAARAAATKKAEFFESEAGKEQFIAAQAAYARWVYGVDRRPTKIKSITNEVALTAPQRLEYMEWLREAARDANAPSKVSLGNGAGTFQKRTAEWRTDLVAAESDLARDSKSFVTELKKELNAGKDVEEEKTESRGQWMDKVTMWFLVAVGACLMAGLFTRLACLLAVGFLTMTYLAHPPFPWYPLPPNTEGNPVFINKNVIEALALLVIATFPTGKWMGLDALLSRVFCRSRCDTAA